MRVLGYDQALSTAIHLRLDETRWVPLASACGIAMMKLVAWADRGDARLGRDAVDFIEVLRQYAHVISDMELYDDHPEAMERYDFRVEPAAAWILGKQVSTLVDDPLREVILGTIRPDSRLRMINYFLREQAFQSSSEREAETALLLEAFDEGLQS